MSYRITLLISALLVCGLPAQTALSPEQAVALALQSNQNLVAEAERVRSAAGLRLQAGLKPNPRLIFQTENTRFGGRAFRYTQDTDNFLYLSQIIEAPGKRDNRVKLAASQVQTREATLATQRSQLAARVLHAYWSAVGGAQSAQILKESLQLLTRTVQYHRDRVREGALPEADLIRIQLEQQQVELSFRNAEQEARRSHQTLFREMGIPEMDGAVLTGDLAAVSSMPEDPEPHIDRRTDVLLAAQSVEETKAAIKLQRSNAKSDVEMVFGYKRTAGFNTALAGMQFNLPFRNRNQGAIVAAEAQQAAASATLRATQESARAEVQALRGEYKQKRELVEQVLPSMRERAAETGRIANAVYREGASDLLRLLDAERSRIQVETLYVRTILDFRLAAVDLQAALGLLP